MAKNWLIGEAVRAIRENNKEAILDFGKRFPLSTVILAQLNDAGVALCDAIPEKVTMRKIEAVLKGDAVADEADDVEDNVEEEEVAPVKKKREKAEMPEPKSWRSMNQYQKKKAKALGEEYVAACKAIDKADDDDDEEIPSPKKAAKKAKKPVVEEYEDEDDDEEEEEPVKKPAKKEKKAEKKPKKAAKKEVEEDEDDDDHFGFDLDDDDE